MPTRTHALKSPSPNQRHAQAPRAVGAQHDAQPARVQRAQRGQRGQQQQARERLAARAEQQQREERDVQQRRAAQAEREEGNAQCAGEAADARARVAPELRAGAAREGARCVGEGERVLRGGVVSAGAGEPRTVRRM